LGSVQNYYIIQAIFISNNKELLELTGKLLLAAKLQEGVRQEICENMDRGLQENFEYMFKIIYDNDLIRCGIELSDIIITPVRPSKIEVKGLQEFVQMINQSSFNAKNHYILLNNVQSRSIKDVEDMTDSIKGAKLNLLHTRIGLRKLFMDAYAEGKSVIELNKSSLAADELRVLVKELKDIIKRKA